MNSLPRVRSGLLCHPLDQQMLVYDPLAQQVHLLDPTTGCVLELMQKGGYTPEGIGHELAERNGVSPNPNFLVLAIEELRQANLLDQTVEEVEAMNSVSRREAIRNLALTGAAAVMLPAVVTLVPTRAYAQGTAPATGVGGACNGDSQCISGNCCGEPNGVCSTTGCPQPNGQLCTAPGQCASGVCSGGVCAGLANCAPCTTNAQCLGGTCNNLGACTATADKQPSNGACSGTGPNSSSAKNDADKDCCSANCVGTFNGGTNTYSGVCQ